MAREAKFTFISEDLIGKKPKYGGVDYRVTLQVYAEKAEGEAEKVVKQVNLVFPGEVCKMYDLEGKRVKFYLDAARKAIAWRVIEGETTLEELDKARVVKIAKNGVWKVSIMKLVNASGVEVKESRYMVPVKTYREQDLITPRVFWYIKLDKMAEE